MLLFELGCSLVCLSRVGVVVVVVVLGDKICAELFSWLDEDDDVIVEFSRLLDSPNFVF